MNYIKLNNQKILLQAIVTWEYNEEIEEDGDVEDKEPVTITRNISGIQITLSNGDVIRVNGNEASELNDILEGEFTEIADINT